VLQVEEMPTMLNSQIYYTHLDLISPHKRKQIIKLRREFRKGLRSEPLIPVTK
jgi:hypothetical protein